MKKRALEYHAREREGKTEVQPTKPFNSMDDLSLAYTPGVAAPVEEIYKERWKAYRYTNKGNLVAVVSNGSAVLGKGNVGALASKPVMEGKAMLFKVFADIDAFDIEISDEDPERIIATISSLAPTFGGINLEDIKAPECFYIEEKLRSLLDIPVLHDDQHGTAAVVAAALMNACEVAGKRLNDTKIVICGAGAAGISVARMLARLGADRERLVMIDSKGVINTGRKDIDETKREFATTKEYATLSQAMTNADVFIGVSKGNLLTVQDIEIMSERPVIFALANPTPEIDYRSARTARPDAIVATGRTDLPNQINNSLVFPYLFRGALDTLATKINGEMLIAAAHAVAGIAKQPIAATEETAGKEAVFGPEHILPKMNDRRLLTEVSAAVARAAIESGVARRGIASFKEYRETLLSRVDNSNFFSSEVMRHRNNVKRHRNCDECFHKEK